MKSLKIGIWVLLSLLFTTALRAEYRSYTSAESREAVIDSIFAHLKKSGFRYRVRSVLTEKKEGRMGVLLWLYPGKNHCEISFYRLTDRPGTLVRIYTQDTRDALRFHHFFTATLKLHPEGMVEQAKTPRGAPWPAPR